MTLEEAAQVEREIAEEAARIRGDAKGLSPAMFMELWPLLCRPIPDAYIVDSPSVTGKPYASTGIKSVQVQVDRMNNVLSPLWWWDEAEYDQDGKVCKVTVSVGERWPETDNGKPYVLVSRSSYGGVERGSTTGNVYKGSYTNAAKLAFARIGPGREVYIGATDMDPDVSEELAEQENAGEEIARTLWNRANQLGLTDRLQLAASHVTDRNVGSCEEEDDAVKALSELSFEQAERLDSWLSRKADERSSR